jgi:hypothetical protein
MNIKYEEINYSTFGKCLKITSKLAEVIVTLEVGPRIISYRLLDGENIFFEDTQRLLYLNTVEMDEIFYKGATWYGLGGHRLWRSPESYSTYYPEEHPIKYDVTNDVFTFIQPVQEENEVELSIVLQFLNESDLKFEGTITNKSKDKKQIASWSLSMCKGPGLEIVKLPNNETGFLPQRSYSLWGFGAKNKDPRAFYGNDYFALRMELGNMNAYKVGMMINEGKILYLSGKNAYVKRFNRLDNEIYPDNNVNYETYTKHLFMELETLSPLKELQPNESVTQTEVWSLYKLVDKIPTSFDEQELGRLFEKYANKKGSI